jgi:hypothetical protein
MKKKMLHMLKKVKVNERTVNYVLIFVLGFLVGIAVKTEAKNRITIGYADYLVNGMKQGFDLNQPLPSAAPPESQQQPAQNAPAENQPAQ